jgi:tetratricopeptide (TPR) repeat protein
MNLRPLLVAVLLATPGAASGQVAAVGADTLADVEHAPDDVRGAARDAQRDFERTRLRHAPLVLGGGMTRCDESVGRFCTSYDEDEWYPREEEPEVTGARSALVAELDSLQRLGPDDGWILGQRVWYRADGGDWAGALAEAQSCGGAEPWWCAALQGLALHGLGRYEASERAFERALTDMDPERARDWRVPEKPVDGDARRVLRQAEEAGADSLATALSTLWALADPLYVAEGNDRLTAHYARWTASEIKRDARNPYGMGWADDLEELTVRHGWELGWERSRSTLSGGRETAIGHKHPEGRDYMPTGRALRNLASAGADAFAAARREPRSLYAPPYAPIILPMDAQVAVFPRGARMAVVASPFLPTDTSFHAGHGHPRKWIEPGGQAGMPDEIGLFALPVGGGDIVASRSKGHSSGALVVEVPTGSWVISVESWSPELRRAGRLRLGVRGERPPEDVPTVSDLLLLEPRSQEPLTLEEALPLALARARVVRGFSLAIAWELYGLGFRTESLLYAVSVERTDRNVFRRIGEFFRLSDRPQPLALSWQEPAPDSPGAQFRYLDLDLPPLAEGRYRITLTLRTAGRSDVHVTKDFEVIAPE